MHAGGADCRASRVALGSLTIQAQVDICSGLFTPVEKTEENCFSECFLLYCNRRFHIRDVNKIILMKLIYLVVPQWKTDCCASLD